MPDRAGPSEPKGPLPDHPDRAVRDLDPRERRAVRPLDPSARPPRREIVKPIPHSMRITGTVAEWEQWTGMKFPGDGHYTFPAG
jgi:hypothetical protein